MRNSAFRGLDCFARLVLHVAAVGAITLGLTGPALANVAPTVRITSPADCGLVVPDGNSETLVEADADDPDGSIVAVRFYSGFNELCSVDSIAPYTSNCRLTIIVASHAGSPGRSAGSAPATCTCDIPGFQPETRIYAVAVDNLGATTSSDTIRVRPTFNGAPPAGSFLALPDPGFDSSSLPDGAVAPGPGTIGAWTFAGTAGATLGVLNPTAASYLAAAGNGTPAGANGANIAYLSVPAGAADSAQAFQALPDTLRTYSRYELAVAVGWPLDAAPDAVSPFDGATFELWAGSTVIVQGNCSSRWQEGEFFDLVGTVASDQLPPALIGQPLSIHVKLGAGDAARTVHIDRVRLSRETYVTPGIGVPGVPVAATLAARAVPNPAFAAAAIEFMLEREEFVTLSLFDPAGRAVGTPSVRRLAAGPQRIALPADLAPGLYFARLDAGLRWQTLRVVRLAR